MQEVFSNGTIPGPNDPPRVILVKILDALNAGGGGGGGTVDYIAYSGPPAVNPPNIQHVVVDVDGRQWQYFNGAWA